MILNKPSERGDRKILIEITSHVKVRQCLTKIKNTRKQSAMSDSKDNIQYDEHPWTLDISIFERKDKNSWGLLETGCEVSGKGDHYKKVKSFKKRKLKYKLLNIKQIRQVEEDNWDYPGWSIRNKDMEKMKDIQDRIRKCPSYMVEEYERKGESLKGN